MNQPQKSHKPISLNKTKIEWTNYSWNPITGCLNDCPYCYVRRLEERFGYSRLPQLHMPRLKAPFSAREGSKIFVCSTADLFGPWIPGEWIEMVLDIVRQLPNLKFQFLTKFPHRYLDFKFPKNCWLGTTIEDDSHLDRFAYISEFKSHVRFVSFEPLLGRIPIGSWLSEIDWMIIGAFTGEGRAKYQPALSWIQDLVKYADKNRQPVFMKNNLKEIWQGQLRQEYPVRRPAKQLAEVADGYRFSEVSGIGY